MLRAVRGHRPSQLAKCFSSGNRPTSTPISARITSAVAASIPSIAVRSTPRARDSWAGRVEPHVVGLAAPPPRLRRRSARLSSGRAGGPAPRRSGGRTRRSGDGWNWYRSYACFRAKRCSARQVPSSARAISSSLRAAPLVAQRGQLRRVALAGQDGLDDRRAGHAGDVADDLGELDVHLLQRLLHVLDVVRGVADQHLPLPPVAAQGQHRVGRAERRAEQAVGVQPLDPLAVEPVGLGPGPAVAGLAGLDEEDLEAAGFEQLEQGDPVDAGGFHARRW